MTAPCPGYQTIAVYSPEKQTTLVIFINTDMPYGQARDALARAITKVIAPDQLYALAG